MPPIILHFASRFEDYEARSKKPLDSSKGIAFPINRNHTVENGKTQTLRG
uniref:Uncharacterized protein n=1 Tax=Heterorhabditis bacteriophora TaxID=37862 RepID=A0A1I7WG20_HETBA